MTNQRYISSNPVSCVGCFIDSDGNIPHESLHRCFKWKQVTARWNVERSEVEFVSFVVVEVHGVRRLWVVQVCANQVVGVGGCVKEELGVNSLNDLEMNHWEWCSKKTLLDRNVFHEFHFTVPGAAVNGHAIDIIASTIRWSSQLLLDRYPLTWFNSLVHHVII